MKKVFALLLLFCLSLPSFAKPNYSYSVEPVNTSTNYSGAYVNEEISVPVSKIGLPQEYMEPEVVQVEKGLEIVWNEWHAKVRNKVLSDVRGSSTPSKHLTFNLMTVDRNKNISDIIVIYVPETSLTRVRDVGYVTPDSDIYMYIYEKNTYYKIKVKDKFLEAKRKNIEKILSNSDIIETNFYTIPNFDYFAPLAQRIQNRQGDSYLAFPKGSKRSSMVVTQGTTDISWLKAGSKYMPEDFNDTERY